MDGAFLLLQHAARNGDAAAATALGRLYDPEFFAAGKSPVAEANVERAIDWYDRAAKAGDAEATARLAELRKDSSVANPAGAPPPKEANP
jgi:TPR repeat protein